MDQVLFTLLGLMWLTNIIVMIFWRKKHNKIVTAVLYGVIGVIVVFRLTEVTTIQVYGDNWVPLLSGALATYAKIALGCCQIYAMHEIRMQMKGSYLSFQIAAETEDSFHVE